MPRVKILYRYIAREYLFAFIVLLGLCVLLMGLNLFFDKFEDIVDHEPPFSLVVQYILYSLPGELIDLMPLIALLAVLFGIGILSKNHEVLAMHACGVSYTVLGVPVFACAIVLSILAFLFGELVLPRCEQKRVVVDAQIQQEELDTTERHQYEPTRNWVYFAGSFNSRTMTMENPTIINMGKNGERMLWKLSARKAVRISEGKEDDLWRFHDAILWRYGKDGSPAGSAKKSAVYKVRLKKHLDKILGPEQDPSQMGLVDLAMHIGILRDNGENAAQYETDFHKKLAFPFSTIILALIGYTIAVRAHVRPMVVGFSYGLAAGIIYYISEAAVLNLGHKGIMSPMIATWLPNLAFLGFAVYRIRYMNQVRD